MLQIRQNNQTLFSVHNEMMKRFRRSHGRVATLLPTAVKERDIISRTRPMVANYAHLDYGGSYRAVLTMSRFTCPLLPKIAGYKLSPN